MFPPWVNVTFDVDVIIKSVVLFAWIERLVEVVVVVSVLNGEVTVNVEEAVLPLGLLMTVTA